MSNALIESFVAYLRAERGLSDNTIANYRADVVAFAEDFQGPFASAGRKDLQSYLSGVLKAGASPRTAARHLASLRQLYRFLIDEGEAPADPTFNQPVPKMGRRLPKILTQADFEKMVDSLGNDPLEIRDKAMLLVFFGSGLRESELADLNLDDVDLDARVVKIWGGKGGKDGLVPLSPRAAEAIEHYAAIRPKSDSERLFLGRYGQPLSRMAIWIRVSNIAKTALGRRVSPHMLRHGFATALIEGGADIRDVQTLMRHSLVDTTAIYIHTDLTYLKGVYYASHPRGR